MKLIGSYKKILIFFSLIVVILCTVSYFLFADLKKRNENISLLKNDLTSEFSTQSLMASMEATLRSFNTDIVRAEDSIVPSDGDVVFIEKLESLAKSNGLDVEIDSLVLQDDPLISSSSLRYFNIKGKTVGSWVGTYLFLSELESVPTKVKINSYSFKNISDPVSTETKIKIAPVSKWESVFEISVLKNK